MPSADRYQMQGSRLQTLRATIARIEGEPLHKLEKPREGAPFALPFGVPALDACLGGGISAGLTELRLEETRDAGAGAGFAVALGILAGASVRRPLVWIGERHVFGEAGRASAAGLRTLGLDPRALLVVAPRRLEEAIWAGEEAARSGAPCLVVLEARGNPKRLGLEGTRRLHVRAKDSGRPFLMLRQGSVPETSAAPFRLRIAGHPGAPPGDLASDPAGGRLLGTPTFAVTLEKSREGRSRQFLLEWNVHEQRFSPLAPSVALSGPVLAEAAHRPHPAREAGALVAFRRAS